MAADDMMQTFRTKPVTNGDYIRQMTDEELSKFMNGLSKPEGCDGSLCEKCSLAKYCVHSIQYYAQWLKSPRDAE